MKKQKRRKRTRETRVAPVIRPEPISNDEPGRFWTKTLIEIDGECHYDDEPARLPRIEIQNGLIFIIEHADSLTTQQLRDFAAACLHVADELDKQPKS